MIGTLLLYAHYGFQRITYPIRKARALKALCAASEAKDGLRHAKLRNDASAIDTRTELLRIARDHQRRTEIALFKQRNPHTR